MKLDDLPSDVLDIIFTMARSIPHANDADKVHKKFTLSPSTASTGHIEIVFIAGEDRPKTRQVGFIGLARKTQEAAERAFYRSISLKSHHAIRSLCRTLRTRPDLASYIREISLCSYLSAAYDESMVFFAFTSLLRSCIRITHLNLSVDGRHLFELTQLSDAISDAPACQDLQTLIFQTRSGSNAEIGCFLNKLHQLTHLELSTSFQCQSMRGLARAPVRSLTFSSSLISSTAQTNLGGVLEALSGTLRSLTLAGTMGLRYSSVLHFFTNAHPKLDTLCLLGNFCNGRHPVTTEEPAWELLASLCPHLRRLIRTGTGARASARKIALEKLPVELQVLEITDEHESVWKQLEDQAFDSSWLPKLEVLTYNGTDYVRASDGALVYRSLVGPVPPPPERSSSI